MLSTWLELLSQSNEPGLSYPGQMHEQDETTSNQTQDAPCVTHQWRTQSAPQIDIHPAACTHRQTHTLPGCIHQLLNHATDTHTAPRSMHECNMTPTAARAHDGHAGDTLRHKKATHKTHTPCHPHHTTQSATACRSRLNTFLCTDASKKTPHQVPPCRAPSCVTQL
jgi:hypothetical protein